MSYKEIKGDRWAGREVLAFAETQQLLEQLAPERMRSPRPEGKNYL